jgi:putative spermidine/putrescine transport system permease protein
MTLTLAAPGQTAKTVRAGGTGSVINALGGFRLWWLVLPAFVFFLIFFITPVVSLFALSFNKSAAGVITFNTTLTLDNFERIFTRPLYYEAIFRSIGIAAAVSCVTVIFGYPLAYLIAKTEHAGRNAVLMVMVLSSMQLDTVIRMYGLMVLLGDNGLINGFLKQMRLIDQPLPLMYNTFGVIVGLVQISLPFMVLSLIGIIKAIHPSLEEAARSLGATRGQVFRAIILPLSMPGILAGVLLVFALSISSYVVPALMGGWKVMVLPIHIYQQIAESGRWQLGSAVAVILFVTSILAIAVYQRAAVYNSGGRT